MIKFSVAQKKTEETRKYWEAVIHEGWIYDYFGLGRWRVMNVSEAFEKETGREALFVEIESNIVSYLAWIFSMRKKKKNNIVSGWLSEKGVLRT